MGKITAIINYCTIEHRFLGLVIKEAKHFADQILVVVCDHLFSGEKENRSLLEKSYADHLDCQFVEFAYGLYGINPSVKMGDKDWQHYCHSVARYVGYHFVDKDTESVLFIDTDEIFEGKRFKKWYETFDHTSLNAMKFSSYFYFREPCYRARSMHSNGPLLCKRDAIDPELLLDVCERKGVFDSMRGDKLNHVCDDTPMVHHYSWVRTFEELLCKVKSWGHCHDKDWEALLVKEYSQEFRGKDLLFGLTYDEVEPLHDPLHIVTRSTKLQKESKNLIKVGPQDILAKSIEHLLD